MRLYLRALSYYRHELTKIMLLLTVIASSTIFGLMQAWPIAVLLDSVLMPTARPDWMHRLLLAPLPTSRLGQIVGLALMILAFRLGQELLNMARTLLNHDINYSGLMRIRCELYRKVQRLNMAFHKSRPEGDTIYRLSYDTYGCLIILNTLVMVVVAVFTLALMAVMMFSRNWQLTLIALSVAPPLVLTNIWFSKPMKSRTLEGKVCDSEFLSHIQRSIGSIGLMQAFGRESHEFSRFQQAAGNNIRAWLRMHWQEVVYALAVGAIMGLGTTLIFGYGGYLVYRDQFVLHAAKGMTVGDLMIILTYLTQLYDPLCKLSGAGATVMTGVTAAQRVFELLDNEPDLTESPDAIALPVEARLLEIDRLSFSYQQSPSRESAVLRNASCAVRPGEMVAFVGPSGAGKSTLLNLLPRFYDPFEGSIRLDGHDLRDLKFESVRKHIALVPQESVLLPSTIAENIKYGKPEATEEEVREAAALAGASPFIEALPDGYETTLAECGKNLSGGQKQRLCIARALVTGAPILVFDEPTSALDAENEHRITETLEQLKGKRTIILVSHRLSSVVRCDRIFMMKKGQIVERGTHRELMLAQGHYYAMAKYQMRLEGPVAEEPVAHPSPIPSHKVWVEYHDPFPTEFALTGQG